MAWACRRPEGPAVLRFGLLAVVDSPQSMAAPQRPSLCTLIILTQSLLDVHACYMVPWHLTVSSLFHLCPCRFFSSMAFLFLPLSFHQRCLPSPQGLHLVFNWEKERIPKEVWVLLKSNLELWFTLTFRLCVKTPADLIFERFWCRWWPRGFRWKCLWLTDKFRGSVSQPVWSPFFLPISWCPLSFTDRSKTGRQTAVFRA